MSEKKRKDYFMVQKVNIFRVVAHSGCLILALAFLVAGVVAFQIPALFPYEKVEGLLQRSSNLGRASFFDQAYYDGVVVRAKQAGYFLLLSVVGSVALGRLVVGKQSRFSNGFKEFGDGLRALWQEISHDKVLIIILLVGFGIRLLYLFQPASSDEVRGYYAWTSRPFLLAISDYRAPQHLLYTILDYPLVRMLGNAEWVIRLPAFLAGILLPALGYYAGKRWWGREVGLIAAGLIAVNAVWIHYSVTGRGYTMLACLTLIFWIASERFLTRKKGVWLLVMILAGGLGMMALPTMMYPLAGTYLWLGWFILFRQKNSLSARVVNVAPVFWAGIATIWITAMAYLPAYVASDKWYSVDADDVSGVVAWAELPGRIGALGIQLVEGWNLEVPGVLSILFGLGAVTGLLLMPDRRILFLIIANIAGVLFVFAVLRIVPYPRVLVYLSLLYWFLVAGGLNALFSKLAALVRVSRPDYFAIPGWFLIMFFMASIFLRQNSHGFTSYGELAPGVRDAMIYLRDHSSPGDHIISAKPAKGPLFYYHLRYGMNNQLWMDDERSPPLSILEDTNSVYVLVNNYTRQSLNLVLGAIGWANEVIDRANEAEVVYSNDYASVYELPSNER